MCGRFTLTASGEELAEALDLDEAPELTPRYNIAPTQPVVAVTRDDAGARRLATFAWGLRLADARKGERPLINARAESAARRGVFRDAFAKRRCLVPADGFYEWQGAKPERQPWYVRLAAGGVFAFAGLWEPAHAAGAPATCTLLTTEPNAVMAPLHDRMPVILPPDRYAAWLDPERRREDELRPLLVPYAATPLTAYRVGPRVNRAQFDDPLCIAPLA
jgi:putative SOS response-associated peptidase YedK